MKPRSRMLDTPGISVSVPATKPAVQDSAVATVRFLRLQMSSRRFAASTMSSSSMADQRSRQPDRCGGIGGHAFAAAYESHHLVGRRLHPNSIGRDAGNLGNAGAHGVAMRTDL